MSGAATLRGSVRLPPSIRDVSRPNTLPSIKAVERRLLIVSNRLPDVTGGRIAFSMR
jgi:hypothetical protein